MEAQTERPIAWCRTCKTDVILMPNGTCQWCDTHVKRSSRNTVVERLHRQRLEAA